MAESRQAPPTALRALRAPTSDEVMRKSRCRSAILQTCNMTPCSLYRPTSHNNTSSTNRASPAEAAPHPGRTRRGHPGSNEPDPRPDRDEHEPPTIPEDPYKNPYRESRALGITLRTTINSSILACMRIRCDDPSPPEVSGPLRAANSDEKNSTGLSHQEIRRGAELSDQ